MKKKEYIYIYMDRYKLKISNSKLRECFASSSG